MIGKAFRALPFALFALFPLISDAAMLSVHPSAAEQHASLPFTVEIRIASDETINAASGSILFPPDTFEILSVSTASSVFDYWPVEASIYKEAGIVHFEGVALSGFQGSEGTVLVVSVRALREGSAVATFLSGHVLADDGQGTDVTKGLRGGVVEILPTDADAGTLLQSSAVLDSVHAMPESEYAKAPTIKLKVIDGEKKIVGISEYPNASVLVTFVPLSGSHLYVSSETDVRGVFTLTIPDALEESPFSATAILALPDNVRSLPSGTLFSQGYGGKTIQVSQDAVTYASLVVAFCLLPLFFYVLWQQLGPGRDARHDVHRELREAEETVHRYFRKLQDDVRGRDMKVSAQGQSNEERAFARIEDDLRDAENQIEKEIQAVKRAIGT